MNTKPTRVMADSTGAAYERDLYEWALQNARLLREGRLTEIDAANVAEQKPLLDAHKTFPRIVM